ncbi:MAG: hypothetical protein KDA42_03315 [Planctomycetales bacterium]|nr:hypothetical protein [Planctomycetales bacterium]
MEARTLYAVGMMAVLSSLGASYRTANFVVDAPTPQLAKEIGDNAEIQRRELAVQWLGATMPNWAQPCMLTAQVAPNLGAGGATSFVFEHGEVFGWRMTIQGSRERILDSVLPHEITHTIFACHFREALPRWADEGACTTVEHSSERAKQERMLITFLQTGRGISFSRMFAMKEYPSDIMPLYSQGYSLARFLLGQGGKRRYLQFVRAGLDTDDWPAALRSHYGYDNLLTLQNSWLDWVRKGSPEVPPGPATQLVAATVEDRHVPGNSDLTFRTPHTAADGGRLVPVTTASPSRSAARDDVATHSLSRQQQLSKPLQPEHPRQVILQWNKSSSASIQSSAVQRNSVSR